MKTAYRMSLEDFDALVQLLGDDVVPNFTMSGRRCDAAIYPEMAVAIGIRVLAGGNYDDIMNTYGISKSGFYFVRDKCSAFDINLPTEASDWETVRKGFTSKSSNQVLTGCCGAIDGFFQKNKCPTAKESGGFPRTYFSGHYQSYVLNCQAICDSRLRFLFFSVIAPGQTNDAVTFEQTFLHEIIDKKMASGTYIAGDVAYIQTEHTLVPFTGSSKQDPDKDSYNFYLSQLRI
jgi:hypothetical protein